jgi:guanylate kinase
VFILPPSMADLRRRLIARAQDEMDVIERRLTRAYGEIRMWAEYDYVIVNDDFDNAYAELAHIYHAERSKRLRNPWLKPLVDRLLQQQG